MKLNPRKCVFGIRSGKFLGYLVSLRGIEANSKKVQVVLDLAEPKSKKNVMGLTGRTTSLSRFIEKSTEKTSSFFKVLRGNKDFE